MSMTLILWKGPVVREAEEAETLLKPYYEREDDSAFEASPAIAAFAEELRALYPWRDLTNEETVARMSEKERAQWKPEALKEVRGVDGGEPFASIPFDQTDRLLLIDIVWSADSAVLDDITRLAREHELVLYDPQGPEVYLPDDPLPTEGPDEPLGAGAYALAFGVTLFGAALIALGWKLPVPVLNWLLIAGGLFVLGVGITLLYAFIVVPYQVAREAEAERQAQHTRA